MLHLKTSKLEKCRLTDTPELPPCCRQGALVDTRVGGPTLCVGDCERVKGVFPRMFGKPMIKFSVAGSSTKKVKVEYKALKVGVVLSGGQASGGHNVISGLHDYLKSRNKDSGLIGFLNGPNGIMTGQTCVVDEKLLENYRNMGGFDIIGSGRHKIETPAQFKSSVENCNRLGLDGLVVIGGDDSNTNAALLAEYFEQEGSKTLVIGVPKTIDGDLKCKDIEVSFGFDTATKTYAELIGNIATDCLSAKKYYHFVKLMGRDASHITLECALQTHPNAVFISEEIKAKRTSLSEIVSDLADTICQRSAVGKDYGVVLVPEGLIDFIPEINPLISEMNEMAGSSEGGESHLTVTAVRHKLTALNAATFNFLPASIQSQLCADRDPHGNVQVSRIETEKLLSLLVEQELVHRKVDKSFTGTFQPLCHFLGYEGRCALPSVFDSNYCYTLGHSAAMLLSDGRTGYMASVQNLAGPVSEWDVGGVPLTTMMNFERRKGKDKPVIKKALVVLETSPAFAELARVRESWKVQDCYRNPGPIQFYGKNAGQVTQTLKLESKAK